MKYIKYVREHFDDAGFPVVSMRELRTALKLKGISDQYLKRLTNYLLKRGELVRIRKGFYTLQDDITVVGFAFRPFYYGLENALTIRKIWDQGTNPIIITPLSVRNGTRKFDKGNYEVCRINREKFFGYDLVKYYDFWIPVSDYEKTIIDFIYFKHQLGNDSIKKLERRLDRKKLNSYLKFYDSHTRRKIKEIFG